MDRDTIQSLVTRPWTGKPDAGQGEGRLAWQADGDERRDLLLSHPSSGEEEEEKNELLEEQEKFVNFWSSCILTLPRFGGG